MPPESLLQSTYGPKTDIWAYGIFMYEMLHGDTPLGFCHAEAELKANVVKPIQMKAFKPSVPEDLRDLIIRCLEVDDNKRIGAFEIESHRYMQRIMR
jgi:serine/threonine protein kinase